MAKVSQPTPLTDEAPVSVRPRLRVRFPLRLLLLWVACGAFGLVYADIAHTSLQWLSIEHLEEFLFGAALFWLMVGAGNEALHLLRSARSAPEARVARAARLAACERLVPAVCLAAALLQNTLRGAMPDGSVFEPEFSELWPLVGYVSVVVLVVSRRRPTPPVWHESSVRRIVSSATWVLFAAAAVILWASHSVLVWLVHMTTVWISWSTRYGAPEFGPDFMTDSRRFGFATLLTLGLAAATLYYCRFAARSVFASARRWYRDLAAWCFVFLCGAACAFGLVSIGLPHISPYLAQNLEVHRWINYALAAIVLWLVSALSLSHWRAAAAEPDAWWCLRDPNWQTALYRSMIVLATLSIVYVVGLIFSRSALLDLVTSTYPDDAMPLLVAAAIAQRAIEQIRHRHEDRELLAIFPAGRSAILYAATWLSYALLTVSAALAGFGAWLLVR